MLHHLSHRQQTHCCQVVNVPLAGDKAEVEMSKQGIRSQGHFGSNWTLHLDHAYQRTEGVISMIDFARKPARQQAVRLSPLSAFIRRVC